MPTIKLGKLAAPRAGVLCSLALTSWGALMTFPPSAVFRAPECVACDRQRPPSADRITSPDSGITKPGERVGGVRIGDTRTRAIELFGKPTDELRLESDCPPWTVHWVDFANERSGVFVYMKNGRIFQIQAETPRYATVEGIKSDSSPGDVRRFYPQSRAYQLTGSGSKNNGGRDLIYWVDREKGIAFELRYSYKTRKRLVSYIFVYEPGSNFQPEGCVSAPQQWRELKPFTSEVSGNRARKKRGK